MASYTDVVCRTLIKSGSYLRGDFTLSSGMKSDTYIDCRKAFLSSMHLSMLIPAYIEALGRSFDGSTLLCGIPTSGLILTGAILQRAAVHCEVRACYLRPETKDHGTKKNFEGDVREGDKVTILDDVLTSGKTVLNAIMQIQARGLVVDSVVVLLDREMVDFASMVPGIRYKSLITMAELKERYDEHQTGHSN